MTDTVNSGVLYGKSYQCSLLAHLVLDQQFCKTCISAVSLTDFELPACQLVLETLQDYFYRFKRIPDLNMLELHLMQMMNSKNTVTRLAPEENESLVQVMQNIYSYVGRLDPEYFRVQLPDFLKSVRVAQAVSAHQQGIMMGQSSSGLINQIAKINKDVVMTDEIVIDNAHTNPEPVMSVKEFNRINTGLQSLNLLIGGGLGCGELGMITACPGVGKTTSLLNFYEGAIVTGNRSLFISLEMGIRRIKHRYQSIAAGIPAHYFKIPVPDWPEDIMRRYNAILVPDYRLFGYASMVDMSTRKHTPADIDVAIEKWKDAEDKAGHDVNTCRAVYVDWLDMLELKGLSVGSDTKTYELLKEACFELSRIGKRHNVALWTATQGTREADGREVLSMKHVAGAYQKNWALDIGLGLGVIYDPTIGNQPVMANEDDSLINQQAVVPCSRRLKLNLMKNRDNPMRAIDIYQGQTLKFWNKSADATLEATLLSQGDFISRTRHVQEQASGKKRTL